MVTSTQIVTQFVNTWDILEGRDSLATPEALGAWSVGQGLAETGTSATEADLRRARGLREALRALLLAHNGVEADTAAANAVLDEVARRARVELRFDGGRAGLVPQEAGIDGALGRIAAAVHETMADGTWERLKACRAEDCHWAFVDNAKNRSRAWCSMSECGNRAKARAYRRRHHDAAAP
jgi:predicted RNA-binding Zn ribbon-like protein